MTNPSTYATCYSLVELRFTDSMLAKVDFAGLEFQLRFRSLLLQFWPEHVPPTEGALLFHKNLPNAMPAFLQAVDPFRHDIAVGVESTFKWYWLADGCALLVRFEVEYVMYFFSVRMRRMAWAREAAG